MHPFPPLLLQFLLFARLNLSSKKKKIFLSKKNNWGWGLFALPKLRMWVPTLFVSNSAYILRSVPTYVLPSGTIKFFFTLVNTRYMFRPCRNSSGLKICGFKV